MINKNAINANAIFLSRLYKFICEHEAYFLNIYDFDSDNDDNNDSNNSNNSNNGNNIQNENNFVTAKPLIKYEDKYLEKFNLFPNEFSFTELELEAEQRAFEEIKMREVKYYNDSLQEMKERLEHISCVNKIIIDSPCISISTLNALKDYFHKYKDYVSYKEYIGEEEISECDDDYDKYNSDDEFERDKNDDRLNHNHELLMEQYVYLYGDLMTDNNEYQTKLNEMLQFKLNEDECRDMAKNKIIKNKLDAFINNYILENTPMGNIYMRYNNDKGSFEYFSNNTIPYRYLEPVGRKYVMTYWCKPIFVDIKEELQKAELKYNEDVKNAKTKEPMTQTGIKNQNQKSVFAKMKNYNQTTQPQPQANNTKMKNRSANNILPPQIKANLQPINTNSEKQYLKEKANRYTWEGRLSDFCPLKKISKKVTDKNLLLTYEDFKRMQLMKQNKK
jgi:hypothetical protein